ncbi:MAG: DUF2069 domain-containing protein [Halomonas sp.]|uniref:DUF2069 domain-containing protein n=1 Tax=Halomonas sp. TaxID=1486246 RepID=UPI003F8EADE9
MRAWMDDFENRKGLDTLTHQSRILVIASFILLLLLSAYRGLMVESSGGPMTPLLVFVLPLLLFSPAIIAKRPRGHAWLAFVSLLYFTMGVMVATLPDRTLQGALEMLASLALFTGSMGYARFRSRQLRRDS